MLETLGWDVVLAGNVILVAYVGLATVLWTARYAARTAAAAAARKPLCSRFVLTVVRRPLAATSSVSRTRT